MIKALELNYKIKKFSILDEVDFHIDSGEFVAIVGPNGAGKSSLLSLLANEVETSETKKVVLKDTELPKWDIGELSFHKAKFSQHYSNDIPLLVREVVMMGRYPYFDSKPKAEDLESVSKMMLETDITHLKEREYNTLSGGEKQRVHLARALVQLENSIEKKILFLDEPLNNLDIKHQYKTLKIIKDFVSKGNSAVVVLHDLNLAGAFADRIFLMKNGKLVCEGTPEDVFEPERIEEVYNFPCTICKNPVNQNPLILFG